MGHISAYSEELKSKPPLKTKWLLLICLLLFIPHLFISYEILEQSSMTDLYARIAGSRLLDAKSSPFFQASKRGDDRRLFVPNSNLPYHLNGVTVTPFYLWLQAPLSKLDYCTIKNVWWIVQELLLFSTFMFTLLIPKQLVKQVITIAISTLFFLHSRNWLVHVHSGQYYVIFAFIFSLTAFLILEINKKNSSLLLFPIIALIRPLFVLAVIPWLLKEFRKRATILAIVGVLSALLTVVVTRPDDWFDYRRAMNLYSLEITGGMDYKNTNSTNFNVPPEPCGDIANRMKVFGAGCLFSVQHYLNLFNIKWNSTLLFTTFLLIVIGVFVTVVGTNRINRDNESLLLASFLIYILSELFTPANRNPYNMIQYLGIMGVFVQRANFKIIALMIVALALNHDFPTRLPYQRELGELIILMAIFSALLIKTNQPVKIP